ncbi:MAG: CZB domain-containing protein [Gammaproteobacteria bacterium]|nr:CZB domain-containing protein [Gammaproteobacteria bacterium]
METAETIPPSLFSEHDYLEVITFYVASTQYATPVSEVRYIEQDKRKTTRIEVNTKLGAEVTTYQGKPVPIYDFAELMGCEADYVKNTRLLQILKDREKDHIQWMDALELSLRTDTEFVKARDPNACEFGKWYSTFKADDELLADIMQDFDEPHKRIHGLAEQLLGMKTEGRLDDALEIFEIEKHRTLGKLIGLFEAARERLDIITRPILLYINTGKKMIAVRLNAISDIVTYYRNDFTTQQDVDDNEAILNLSFVAGYLENKDNKPPCVLLDWRMFNR